MNFFAKHSGIFGKVSAILLSLETLLFPIYPALAVHIPSASEMAADLERRYHINTQAVQNFGEELNVSSQKVNVPEVSLFFSPSDPREGEKLTARAFPMYFSNPNEQLYYTWYLKRKGCDFGSINGKPAYCNADGVGDITINDWKVMAAREIISGQANKSAFDYNNDDDNDGYKANMGGGLKTGTSNDYCYIYDHNSGNLYELTTGGLQMGCSPGYTPACVADSETIAPGSLDCNASASGDGSGTSSSSTSCSGDSFVPGTSGQYSVVGTPACGTAAPYAPTCSSGLVKCVPENNPGPFTSGQMQSARNCTNNGVLRRWCSHLFPQPGKNTINGVLFDATAETSGDNKFKLNEEGFWATDPHDPDTADNGSKDESTITGIGQESFTWNYLPGDRVGVVVEGTSMMSTKHSNSSKMIMWAFSQNKCNIKSTSDYVEVINGYEVKIPTTPMDGADLNNCLESNLIDPLIGGQATKLNVSITYSPDNPVNDVTEEHLGDALAVFASVDNSTRPAEDLLYTWTIEANSQPTGGTWQDITSALKTAGLIGSSSGNGLSSIPITLNMDTEFLSALAPSLATVDPIYLRVSVSAEENFSSSGVKRVGRSDVIIRVTNSDTKIDSYESKIPVAGKVALDFPVCGDDNGNGALDGNEILDRVACRVIKNDIIGLKVDNSGGVYGDFKWTINGTPINCSTNISPDCASGNVIFFAAAGDPGDTYTFQVNANNISNGKTISLSRTFQIVEPQVVFEPIADTNGDGKIDDNDWDATWPKYIGKYKDTDGNSFSDFSDNAFEIYAGNALQFSARFLPTYAKNFTMDASGNVTRAWTVDNEFITNDLVLNQVPAVAKPLGSVYNVVFSATIQQPEDKRAALKAIWGIDDYQSSEIKVSNAVQTEVVENEIVASSGPKHFFAALASYVPSSVLFAFRMIVTMALLLFVVGFIFALIPKIDNEEVIMSRRD